MQRLNLRWRRTVNEDQGDGERRKVKKNAIPERRTSDGTVTRFVV